MRLVAPALAGILIGTVGVDWMYYVIALGFMASILVIALRTRESVTRSAPTSSPAQDIANGMKYVWSHRLVFWLLVMALATLFLGLPFRNLMPAFAVEALKQGPQGYGLLMSVVGLGAIVGSLLIASLGNSGRKGLLLVTAAVGWGVGLIAFSLSTSLSMAIPLLLLLGLTSTGFMTLNNILIQTSVSDEFRGRVLSFYMLTFAMNSVGTVPVGAMAEFLGVGQALMWSGVALLVFATFVGLWRRDLRRLR
jgi:MFS family permease